MGLPKGISHAERQYHMSNPTLPFCTDLWHGPAGTTSKVLFTWDETKHQCSMNKLHMRCTVIKGEDLGISALKLLADCLDASVASLHNSVHSGFRKPLTKICREVLPHLVGARRLAQHMETLREEPPLDHLILHHSIHG